MSNKPFYKLFNMTLVMLSIWSCKPSQEAFRSENRSVPDAFSLQADSLNVADINWRDYFQDPDLIRLIDTALKNNQELNIILQEIEISQNEVRSMKGEYLPFVDIGAASSFEKEGRYTRHGAVDKQLQIAPGKEFPDPFSDYSFGAFARWEVDIWKKLRNSKKAAVSRYLASVEGRNFMQTNLIAEIADAYYELLALDNLLNIVNQNIDIQSSALKVVKQQKSAARVSQLAVNRFEAQLLNTRNLQYSIKQNLVQTENRINFLTGRFPHPINRNSEKFNELDVDSISAGIPSQLLVNRPDIRQAELELLASRLDVKSARAAFYPSLSLSAGLGFQAFNPSYLVQPESILYNLAGDLTAPLINRNAIRATYNTANAQQIQAIYEYEQTILNAYVDVVNELAKLENYSDSYNTKSQEVEILKQSIKIANSLFNSARADYAEVLLTQREALEAKIELIEIKKKQLNAKVNVYRALGGGWN
jgi:NodT family efflux transporter outer membrane factor (OMF) lipoprotein